MPVRVGMIGAGGIAQSHVRALQNIPEAEIVSVYDINREMAGQMAEQTGAHVEGSADQVLDPARVDAVLICTPQFAREELEVTAARRDIPFLVEKPLGIDMDAVRRKGEIIRQSGIVHSVGYCLRYLDTVQMALDYMRGKPVHLVQVFRFGKAHPSRWWRQLELSGGFLVDAVTHQVDLVRYLTGEFREVTAHFGTSAMKQVDPDATIYDAGAVSFALQSGAAGTITESCVSHHHSGSEIKLFGPDFFLHLSRNGKELTIVDEEQKLTHIAERNASYEQDKAFIEAVISGSREGILSTYDDAMKSLAVTLAANRAGQERRVVEV